MQGSPQQALAQLRPCIGAESGCRACVQADAAVTKADAKAPPADIRRYLKATGLIELRYIRKLSSLCAQTYYIRKLTVRLCWRHFFCRAALLTSACCVIEGFRASICAQLGRACPRQLCVYLPLGAGVRDAGRAPFEGPGLWR